MKKLVVLTGAGMSAESGISTFRDSGGLWDRYPVEQVATPEGFRADPRLVLKFYDEQRAGLLKAQPNEGHKLLAGLEDRYEVDIITQNIDDLHERAGSSNVIHLHGELMKGCSSRNMNDPGCIVDIDPANPVIKLGDKALDGSQLRPFIVWFGESVPRIHDAAVKASEADIFLIIGTSMNVYPAAGLLNYVRRSTPVYLIDPKSVGINSTHFVNIIQKGASEGMKDFCKIIDEKLGK